MTVNVPAENAEQVGLRKVIDEKMVSKVLKALTGGGTTMPKNWNRRFKHNRDKMKTGDIFELAEVVRNLSLRDHEKGLSTGEKQMFVKAKKILASELMYAKEMDEDEAAEWLDEVLGSAGGNDAKPSAEAVAGDGLAVRVGLGRSRCGRSRRAARLGPAEGVRAARRTAAARRALERLEESDWIDAIVVVAPPDWEEPAILLAEELAAGKVSSAVTRRRDARRVGAAGARRGARRRRGRARPRRRAAAPAGGGDRARAGAAVRGLGRRRPRRCRWPTRSSGSTATRGRDASAGRARRGADAAGVPRRRAAARP